jgi:hypothetical protein
MRGGFLLLVRGNKKSTPDCIKFFVVTNTRPEDH